MKTIEYHFKDKSAWADGPWKSEPDKKQWMDPSTGLSCLIVRGHAGVLCGYVGVPRDHFLYKKGYSDSGCFAHTGTCEGETDDYHYRCTPQAVFRVHGGLTFASLCVDHSLEENREQGICHLPEPGEPDDVWWFGFDCGHAGDLCPGYPMHLSLGNGHYRDFDYVTEQVTSLAQQLATAKPTDGAEDY